MRSKTKESLSWLVLASALLALLLLTVHWPPRPDRSLHRSLGATLAKLVTELSAPNGHVVVITRDTETFPQPALDLLLSSFQDRLRRTGVKVASVRRMQVDPLRPLEVPAGELFELVRRSQPEDVVVSLLGPPLLSEEQWASLRPLKPKLVAFCPGNFVESIDLNRLLDAGVLHAALLSRTWPYDSAIRRRHIPRTLDELFMSATVSNRSSLPAPAGFEP